MPESFKFSIFWSTLVFVHPFYFSHPYGCKVLYHCAFDVHFPNDYQCWSSFHVISGNLIFSLERHLLKTFVNYKTGLDFFGEL